MADHQPAVRWHRQHPGYWAFRGVLIALARRCNSLNHPPLRFPCLFSSLHAILNSRAAVQCVFSQPWPRDSTTWCCMRTIALNITKGACKQWAKWKAHPLFTPPFRCKTHASVSLHFPPLTTTQLARKHQLIGFCNEIIPSTPDRVDDRLCSRPNPPHTRKAQPQNIHIPQYRAYHEQRGRRCACG